MLHVGGQDAVTLESYQMEVLMADVVQGLVRMAIGVNHQFGAIKPCGIRVVIVVVEQRMSPINLQCPQGCLSRYAAVGVPVNGTFQGFQGMEEVCRTLHLHSVLITLEVRFARNGVDYHQHPCRIHDDTRMGIGSSPIGKQHGLRSKARPSAKHHVTSLQSDVVW